MGHSKALRVIGQSLEAARLSEFEVSCDGSDYVLSSENLTPAEEWILQHAITPTEAGRGAFSLQRQVGSACFSSAAISRLDDQAKRQRRSDTLPTNKSYSRLSQLLRVLGDYLDQRNVSGFRILWKQNSANVDFNSPENGQSDSRTFSAEKLQQLSSHLRFRRSRGTRFESRTGLNRAK